MNNKVIIGGWYINDEGEREINYFCGFDDGYGQLYTNPLKAREFKDEAAAQKWIDARTPDVAKNLNLIGKWEPKPMTLRYEVIM